MPCEFVNYMSIDIFNYKLTNQFVFCKYVRIVNISDFESNFLFPYTIKSHFESTS